MTSPWQRRHLPAITQLPGRVCAQARAATHLHGAEHRPRIEDVMAGGHHTVQLVDHDETRIVPDGRAANRQDKRAKIRSEVYFTNGDANWLPVPPVLTTTPVLLAMA